MKAPELTDLAEAWLRCRYPNAIIVRELGVDGYGAARLDVAAITDRKIVGVEVKGDGDSAARLELQGWSYGRAVTEMWLLPSPDLVKACHRKRPANWGLLEVYEGSVRMAMNTPAYGAALPIAMAQPLEDHAPATMLRVLWRDELLLAAERTKTPLWGASTRAKIAAAILKHCSVSTVHDEMIWALRNRVWMGSKVHLNETLKDRDPERFHEVAWAERD